MGCGGGYKKIIDIPVGFVNIFNYIHSPII